MAIRGDSCGCGLAGIVERLFEDGTIVAEVEQRSESRQGVDFFVIGSRQNLAYARCRRWCSRII
jgi:hypothetical protein